MCDISRVDEKHCYSPSHPLHFLHLFFQKNAAAARAGLSHRGASFQIYRESFLSFRFYQFKENSSLPFCPPNFLKTFLVICPNILGGIFTCKKYMNWPCHGTKGKWLIRPWLQLCLK